MSIRSLGCASALACAVSCATLSAKADAASLSYFVGVDGLSTLTSGTYSGLANPNVGHLTFLWGHPSAENPASSHYHSKAIRTYTGPAGSPTVVRSAGNYVPEGTNAPIKLSAGSGVYAGKLVIAPYDDAPGEPNLWANLTLGSTQALATAAAGTPEAFLFNSSAGRWNGTYADADVHWQLVSLTPGLHVGDASSLNVGLNAPGHERHLGGSDDGFAFTPVLWTDATATPGTYEAVFRLTDESGTFGNSGDVRIVTQVVPEPAALTALAGLGAIVLRRRRAAR